MEVVIFVPDSLSKFDNRVISSGFTLSSEILPPVADTAIAKVPASILSGGIENFVPFRLLTPSIDIVFVPCPLIFAPILFNISAKAITSGSFAALLIIDLPSANDAIIKKK